ncbi:sugar-specific transcriptional regulator TrmB [Methanolobus vulcani]|jgi:predicted transcriptional regulator|uniref:Sugar-specific transcriptional regulator TrmB n=1 Tax=Methanolobus vulcani TaxID=38026 RepID=A0A7Z8P0N3_9EURY|nr:sugar-specific transcriptional regulator TrmB [Methanolobus vulcani]TQD24357.1 sugar-specific transcriptional regulator TrmB [Methanolobus vulcani]
MENPRSTPLEELLVWILSVDRRVILMESIDYHQVIKASDVAQKTNRSTQNISRALTELKNKGIIKCLTPEKTTWKRYMLTDTGIKVRQKLQQYH